MARNGKNFRMGIVGALVLGAVATSGEIGRHTVQVKKESVVRNDRIDYGDEEITRADNVELLGETNALSVTSKTFVPPKRWVFLPFPPEVVNGKTKSRRTGPASTSRATTGIPITTRSRTSWTDWASLGPTARRLPT